MSKMMDFRLTFSFFFYDMYIIDIIMEILIENCFHLFIINFFYYISYSVNLLKVIMKNVFFSSICKVEKNKNNKNRLIVLILTDSSLIMSFLPSSFKKLSRQEMEEVLFEFSINSHCA